MSSTLRRADNEQRNYQMSRLNVREEALRNTDYRRVIDTTPQMQQVVMYITPTDGGIDRESHRSSTQFISVISGRAEAIIDGQSVILSEGSVITVPANVVHEIFNRTDRPLILHTIYAPPVHEARSVQRARYSNKESQGMNQQRREQATQYIDEQPVDHVKAARINVVQQREEKLKALGGAPGVGSAQRRQTLDNMSSADLVTYAEQLRNSLKDAESSKKEAERRLQEEQEHERIREAALRRIARRDANADDKQLHDRITYWENKVFDLERRWPERPRMTTYEDVEKYISYLQSKLT